MSEIIVTGIVGIVTTIVGSTISWLFAKKKYYVEIDRDEIKNMRDSLAFYETLSENNQKVLSEILDKSKELADTNIQLIIEVQNLKAQVGILLSIINSELGDIDFNKYGIKVENGTISRKKIQKK